MDDRTITIEMTIAEDDGNVKSVKDVQRIGGQSSRKCIAWNIMSALKSLLAGHSPDAVSEVVQELWDSVEEERVVDNPRESG